MEGRMIRRLVMVAVAVTLVIAVVLPAYAGPAVVGKLKAFYTSALQGDGEFQWVYCSQATRIVKPDGSAVEEYECELSGWVEGSPPGMGPDIFGETVYPKKAMRFNDDTGWFYFSDFLFLQDGSVCFADEWREQLTPSGKVHFKAVYGADPPCRN